jgi:hypothetical protein
MTKYVNAEDHVDFGCGGVSDSTESTGHLPSLAHYLGSLAAPLTYEAGDRAGSLLVRCADPDSLDRAAANGLSMWIGEIRTALRPWTVRHLAGSFTPASTGWSFATSLSVSRLHAVAHTMRRMLPGEAADLFTPGDQIILSLQMVSRSNDGFSLVADISVESDAIETRLGCEQQTALTSWCHKCEAPTLVGLSKDFGWLAASGIDRMDLAIAILAEPEDCAAD